MHISVVSICLPFLRKHIVIYLFYSNLGIQILLKGASGDELKKVKHVVHYGVFAAYHLALETSFLADEGASLPEFPSTSPIKVALPDKPSSIDRSISMIPGYRAPSNEESFSEGFISQTPNAESALRNLDVTNSGADLSGPQWDQLSDIHYSKEKNGMDLSQQCVAKTLDYLDNDILDSNLFSKSEALGQGFSFSPGYENKLPSNPDTSESGLPGQQEVDQPGELGTLKEEFPPSPSDNQSILVSLSTRCVWKGSVCERSHLFRIKYYGNFDKPLGRFLRDHLFDQVSNFLLCVNCKMVPYLLNVCDFSRRQIDFLN